MTFGALFCVCMFKVWMSQGDGTLKKSEEVRGHRDSLLQAYGGSVKEAEAMLLGMIESSAHLVEWNFESKWRSFEKLLDSIAQQPERLVGSQCSTSKAVEPFRAIVAFWLMSFEQCSMDPLAQPFHLVSQRELEACSTVTDIAELVLGRLRRNEVSFIKAVSTQMQAIEGADTLLQHAEMKARILHFGCFGFRVRANRVEEFEEEEPETFPFDVLCCCAKLTIMSQSHLLLILSFLLGLATAGVELAVRKYAVAGGVLVAVCVLAYWLCNIDEVDQYARLTREVHHLKRAADAVQRHHQDLSQFTDRLRRLDHIWRLRTMPCLDLAAELLEQLTTSTPEEERLEVLTCMGEKLPGLQEGLGPLSLWISEADSSPELLEVAAAQLQSCTEYVEAHGGARGASALLGKRLARPCGFLVVRVLACHNLTNKVARTSAALGGVVQPFVAIKLAASTTEPPCEELRTRADQKSLNPVFEEEFFVPVPWEAEVAELHVYDVSGVSLGYTVVHFRSLPPGAWRKERQRLRSLKKLSLKRSEIDFEMLYAEELRHLYDQGAVAAAPPLALAL